jgi:hypothetical protein
MARERSRSALSVTAHKAVATTETCPYLGPMVQERFAAGYSTVTQKCQDDRHVARLRGRGAHADLLDGVIVHRRTVWRGDERRGKKHSG